MRASATALPMSLPAAAARGAACSACFSVGGPWNVDFGGAAWHIDAASAFVIFAGGTALLVALLIFATAARARAKDAARAAARDAAAAADAASPEAAEPDAGAAVLAPPPSAAPPPADDGASAAVAATAAACKAATRVHAGLINAIATYARELDAELRNAGMRDALSVAGATFERTLQPALGASRESVAQTYAATAAAAAWLRRPRRLRRNGIAAH